ncbi:MAG: hypothetical protein R3Y18_04130, partial [Bacillota bacterium]
PCPMGAPLQRKFIDSTVAVEREDFSEFLGGNEAKMIYGYIESLFLPKNRKRPLSAGYRNPRG